MTTNPSLANGDSAEFWKATAEGHLIFQRCRRCGNVQHPPRHHCVSCWEADIEWMESSGRGTVESFTTVHRAPVPAFRDRAPYVVVSVAMEEGPRMIANLVGDDRFDVSMGDRVEVQFVDDGAGNVLPQFRRS